MIEEFAMDDIVDSLSEVSCDVLVIGGGTAGPMAALKAKMKNPKASVILMEKANVKRSGAISMGMDGLNNAVIPGLGKMKVKEAVAAVATNLPHEQANLRKESAAALGEIADPTATPYLDTVLNDLDPEVRKNARWAVQRILLNRPA
jgi:flavin-dependent dehydrogenase